MARKKIQLAEVNSLPTVVKGSHLTVTTFPDGHTELQWDWDALVKEVREACDSVKTSKPEVKAKSKKSVAKTK
jgi:hypothetical protein